MTKDDVAKCCFMLHILNVVTMSIQSRRSEGLAAANALYLFYELKHLRALDVIALNAPLNRR